MSARPKPAGGDWNKQLRLDMQFVEKVLLDNGEVTAQFVVHSADAIRIIITPWRSDDEKVAYRRLVRMFCTAHDAIACSSISEAWATTYDRMADETDAAFLARAQTVLPRDSERRQEVVMVHLAYRDAATGERRVISQSREIERRANGKPSGLAPYRTSEDFDQLSGPLVEILPPRPPTEMERAMAKATLERMQETME